MPDASAEAEDARSHATDATDEVLPTLPFEVTLVSEVGGGEPESRIELIREFRRREDRIELASDRRPLGGILDLTRPTLVVEGRVPLPLPPRPAQPVCFRDRSGWLLFDEARYRATWTDIARQARESGARILVDTVDEALASYAERRAATEVDLAERDRRYEEEKRLKSLEAARPVLVDDRRGVPATVLRSASGEALFVEEVRLTRLQAGRCDGRLLVDTSWRVRVDPGNRKAGWSNRLAERRLTSDERLLVVKGHGHGLGASALLDSGIDALPRLRSCGADVLLDTFGEARS